MTNAMIDLNILPLETLAEMANESAEQAEKNAKLTVQKAIDAGRYLAAAKEQIEHGQWSAWLGKNWNFSSVTAWRYMSLSVKSFTMKDLGSAKNVNEALRMIADEKAENAPPEERIPDRVTVVDPDETKEVDDDPAPDPPTNRKAAKGSDKVSEDKKPRTQTVVPELIDEDEDKYDPVDDWFACRTLEDVALKWLGETPDDTARKSAAKHLRKLADKLDPPTKFVRPSVDDVIEFCERRNNNVDAEKFVAYYASNGWKLSNGNKMADWQAAVITWESRDAGGGIGKANPARIRKRKAKEVVYDE